MSTPRRFGRALLLSLLIGLVMASAAAARTGVAGFFRVSTSDSATVSAAGGCGRDASGDDEGSKSEGSDEQESESPDPEPSESPEPTPSETPEPSPSETPEPEPSETPKCESDDDSDQQSPPPSGSGDREKACMEAAGMTENGQASPSGPAVKTTGLDNAIAHVLANCIKNPQSQGLLNALRHLVANRERHAAHDAEKAARKAAKEAAKAERKAGKSGS